MNFANKISTFRILSVPFFIACLVYYSPGKDLLRFFALGIFVLGVISDAVDGYIARRTKQKSKAGLILDPLGDKLLLISAFVLVYLKFPAEIRFPAWVLLIFITRDVLILLGTAVIFMVKQDVNILPTWLGKITTAFQMLSVISILLLCRFSYLFWAAAVLFTISSGISYIMKGFKALYALDNSRNNH
jgi:CDP-diacylglycerol--glycerol-3-phosphate 3-phosphatidyltransferase